MLTALIIKGAVSIAGCFGVTLDPRDKALIAAAWMFAMLIGEAVTAFLHKQERQA